MASYTHFFPRATVTRSILQVSLGLEHRFMSTPQSFSSPLSYSDYLASQMHPFSLLCYKIKTEQKEKEKFQLLSKREKNFFTWQSSSWNTSPLSWFCLHKFTYAQCCIWHYYFLFLNVFPSTCYLDNPNHLLTGQDLVFRLKKSQQPNSSQAPGRDYFNQIQNIEEVVWAWEALEVTF